MTESEKDLVENLRKTEYRSGFAIITIQEVYAAADALEKLESENKALRNPQDRSMKPGYNLLGNCPHIVYYESSRFARYGIEFWNTVVLPVGQR